MAGAAKRPTAQLRLDALPAESAGELLEALLGDNPGLAPLKQILVRRGNPFFLEETIRTLVETKALSGERGRYRLTQPIQAIQVPPTVQTMLAARIDRLDPEDKRLLQTASVVGKDVPWALLQPIAELPDETLRRGLDRLQSAEFLYEAGIFPDLEYSFTHALAHEVAYSGLLQERRCALHARIVAAIETLHQDRLGGEVERLAHHALRGQLWEKAAAYCRQAGAKALARSTNREAAAFLEQALAALKHVPETRQTLESGIDVRFDLRAALVRFGEHERIRAYLDEAGRMAETLADPLRIARVSASRGYECWIAAELADALRFGQSAKTVAGTAENLTLQAVTHHNLGLAYHSAGDYSSARDLFREAVQLIEGAASSEQFLGGGFHPVDSRAWLAFTLAALGEFDEGITQGSEGIRIGERINHHYHLTIAYRCLGFLYTEKGDLDQAIRLLERAVDLSRESLIGHGGAPGTLGYAYARSGRVEEGLSLLCETLTAVEASAARWFHTPLVMQLGEAHLLAGRPQDALALAERAVSLARHRAERGHEARALRLVGEIVSHEDPLDVQTAGERYRESMALAVQLGMRPLVAHCHLGLAKLYRRTGRQQEAQEHLTTATMMYREMDMRFYLEQAEAAVREMA
jgi:tetratricopeptide (TPR) repeat protein